MAESPDRALNDLRYYMRAWRAWIRAWRAPLGIPGAVNWLRLIRPSVDPERRDYDDEVDSHILRAIDAEVESLPADKRAAVRLVYMNEALPAVFRSGRMTVEQARRMCDQAELDMLPRLRIRGVVLGGY